MLITKLHIPVYPLNQFIDNFFYYTGFNPKNSIDRLLPDGEVQLIFDFTYYPKYIYDNETLKEIQSCKKVWLSGFRTEPITIPSGKESEMLIVQFKKGKAYSFLSEPMHQLTNYVVDAELVMNTDILEIREMLMEEKSIEKKFMMLEQSLLKCYLNQLTANPYIDFAVSKIVTNPAQCSIKEISNEAGYSQKHIIKLFKECVGASPKEFLKVIRFQKAVQEIEKQNLINWPAIAIDCGYYDQSHFIADFKTFSGFTPAEYINQRGEFLNYVPIR